MTEQRKNHIQAGEESYRRWRKKTMATPEVQAVYEEEAAKKALWLQLVEAREAAGLTQVEMARRIGVSQAQIARIEKSGYDAYTLKTLRRYIVALGNNFELEVRVKSKQPSLRPLAVRS